MADINDVIEANLGLVYQQLHRFNLADEPDAISYAYEALYKAAKTFDTSAGTAFSTYAVCVIANDIRRYLRTLYRKRQLTVVSYDEPVYSNDGNEATLLDTLSGPDNAEDHILSEELRVEIAEALNRVYDSLAADGHRRIFEVWRESDFEAKQKDIAQLTGFTQPYVSRVLSIIKYKMKVELEGYK